MALISGAAIAAFIGLRNLPDTECAFLHYDPPVVSADGIQYCGEDETPTFIDLSRLTFPIEMEMKTAGDAVIGEPVDVTLSFTSTSGSDILPHELAITHTEKLHLLLIDPSLTDYHHIHPVADNASGTWSFSFTPEKPGTYKFFAEFVLTRTQQQVVGVGEILVDSRDRPTVRFADASGVMESGYTFALEKTPRQLKVGSESQFRLRVSREDGQPVELQPVMGAYAHLVAFDEDRDGYAHLHPKFTGKEKDAVPELAFTMLTDKPGKYRLWAQVKLEDEERFWPFDLVIQ